MNRQNNKPNNSKKAPQGKADAKKKATRKPIHKNVKKSANKPVNNNAAKTANTNAKASKTKKNNRLLELILKIVAVVLAICIVAFFAARAFGGMGFLDVEDSARQFVSGTGTGAGYPYSINSSDVIQFEPFNSNIAILTREAFTVLNSSAKEVVRFQHGYSDPEMSVYGGRALIYDKTTGKFTVLNSSKVLGEGSTDAEIYTAVMGKDGSVAFSLKSDSAQSELRVYNENLKKVFAWNGTKEKVFDIAISPNGKGAAVILVGSQNAQPYSKLMIVKFDEEKPVSEFTYDNTVLFDVLYPSSSRVIAYSTDMKTTIKRKTERVDDYKYESATIAHQDSTDSGKSAIVLSEYGNEDNQRVVLFNKRSKTVFEKAYNEKIYAISCTDKYVAVLFENRAVLLRSGGEEAKTFETGKNGKRIVCIDNDVYILNSSSITKNS